MGAGPQYAPGRKAVVALTRWGTATNKKNKTVRAETVFMVPLCGVSSYSADCGALYDEKAGAELLEAIRELLPSVVKRVEIDASAEDEAFVSAAVAQLTDPIDRRRTAA